VVRLHKITTNIKVNEILPLQQKISDTPELAKALGVPENYYNLPKNINNTWQNLLYSPTVLEQMGYDKNLRGKDWLQDNIDTFKKNGIKALGNDSTGRGSPTVKYTEYEIIPLVKDEDIYDIKPVSVLENTTSTNPPKKELEFIEKPIDTPTNVVDDNLKRINEILEQGIKATGIDADPDAPNYLTDYPTEHGDLIRELEKNGTLKELENLVGGEKKLGDLISEIANKQSEVSPRYLSATPPLNEFGEEFGAKGAYGITTEELRQTEIQNVIKNYIDTPTNVVDDAPTLNTDLEWNDDLKYIKDAKWKKGVVEKNNILKPYLRREDLKRIIPQILDGTVSDIDFTRFGIWLMHKSPTPAYGAKPFSSSDALADVTKIVIFNGKSPIDLINEEVLERVKSAITSNIGAFTTDKTTGPNAGKSIVGLSDELILQFGREEGPFANAQQRMKQTIINEHNKLYANAEDYFILFRGGALTDDPVQSFSKDGFQAFSVGIQTNQETVRKGRGIDGYFVNKNDFIDLHSLGLDAKGEMELIVYKEAVDNPFSKTVMDISKGDKNVLTKERLKFIEDNWYITSSELPKEGFIVSDTPGGSLGAAKLNDPLVFDSWVDNLGRTTTSFVDNLPLETVVKNRVKNLIIRKTKQLAKPGSLVVKAVDAWEFGVIGLMVAGIAFNEIDEVPTIITNTAINMFNSMTAPYGIAPVKKEEYDIDYEYINTVLDTGSKVMPTDIIIEKLKPYSLEEGEDVILPGTGVTTTTGAEQQFEPYGEELAKRAEKTVNIKRDEVKQDLLESKGVQEEKMFKQAKPKKSKATGGAGAKIL
jgi:hypothetical protein